MREAAVILFKCPTNKRTFGVTVEKTEQSDWRRIWAFPIDEKQARHEGFDKLCARGSLQATADYPGCPHCRGNNFFRCGRCGKYSCYAGEKKVKCPWCGNSGGVQTAEVFDIRAGAV
ncbi:MAG: hypothetical protein IJZ74_08845 [Clostridia bacterium]|nr:hypothetical protein [Clostridia bacterium]